MKRISRLIIPILIIVIVVGAAAYLVYKNFGPKTAQAAATTYQTAKVATGSVDSTVGATGSIRANQSAIISWQTSGKIGTVNVAIGDKVKAGDVLATLDPASVNTTILQAQVNLLTAQKSLANLNSQWAVNFAQAESNLASAQAAYDTANNNWIWTNGVRGSQTQIDNAQSTYTLDLESVAKAQSAYDRYVNLPADDPNKAQALLNLTNAQTKANTDKATLNWYLGKPTADDLASVKSALDLAKANLDNAKQTVADLHNGPAAVDIATAQTNVDIANITLSMEKITAPFDGTITDAFVKPGDLVSSSTQAFKIDDLSSQFVDLQVSEVDINSVKVGQKVNLTLDAIPNKTYTGEVVKISEYGVSASGAVNFTVSVKLDKPDAQVKPVMTASASIVISQVSNVVLIPNRAVKTINNQKMVFLDNNGTLTPVVVSLGSSAGTSSQLLAGNVKEGDTIVLNPPSTLTTQQQGSVNLIPGGFRAGGGGFGGGGGGFNGGRVPGGN
jgi:HlyD family secretion protein